MIKPLIYNADIRAIEKKAKTSSISKNEADLLVQSKWFESSIQTACRNIFLNKFGKQAKFIQIDNGGKMGVRQRMKKAREGTEQGAADVLLIGLGERMAFVEFKRIDSESKVKPADKQKEFYDFAESCGFRPYFCNNTVYFENVICEEFAK